MNTFLKDIDIRIFSIGLIFVLGCECCCPCEDYGGVTFLTIPILGVSTYDNRICPPPDLSTFSSMGGNIIPSQHYCADNGATIANDVDCYLSSPTYYLWATFKHCCDDFIGSDEYQELLNARKAIHYLNGDDKKEYTYKIAMDSPNSDGSFTIPIPWATSEQAVGTVNVHFLEPCVDGSCESPNDCGELQMRARFTSPVNVPWGSSAPGVNVTSLGAFLLHDRTICNEPPFFTICPQ